MADDDRQIQLQGALNLLPLPLRKIFSYRFRRALHRFGGDVQASQEFHLLASVIEGSLLAHRGQHPAYARRELRMVDVQFDIGGKLSGMAARTQVIRPRNMCATEHREKRLGAESLILRMVTTGARQLALLQRRGFEFEQLAQAGCAGLMQGRPKSVLHGFKIHLAALAALGKDAAQQLVYFPGNFLMDCSSRFFSCSVQPLRCGSTGRSEQIRSLMPTKSSLSR